MTEPTVLLVFAAALMTALATGLGALPLLAARARAGVWLGLGNSAAAGLMLAASVSLITEGMEISTASTLLGLILGLAAIMAAKRLLHGGPDLTISDVTGQDARKVLLIVGIMTAHSAAEGIGVGVSYGGGRELGDFITLAIALHNVPEGLAIALVMVPRGVSVPKAAAWAIFSSLPQPLLAVPAFLFVLTFAPVLPVGLGLAAGAMLWMIFAELMPEAAEGGDPGLTAGVVVLAFAAMMGMTVLIG